MDFYFVMAAPNGFNADHTDYEYVGSELHTDIVEARKEAKRHTRETGERAYVARLVTRYKPGTIDRSDY